MFGRTKRRREALRAEPFPEAWDEAIREHVHYWELLNEADRAELRGHVAVLLDEKTFEGAGGLEMTDEIRVVIAAQAAILLLHREHDYYPRLRSIVVYPHTYKAPTVRRGRAGVIEGASDHRLGESWAHGTVVLSWNSVLGGATNPVDADNVVFHEFAHQLDSEMPSSAGAPRLPQRRLYAAWASVLGEAYEELQDDLERHRKTLLRDYAATNAAEFFAVVTEYFFERPNALKERYPELYDLFARYYAQDPAERTPR